MTFPGKGRSSQPIIATLACLAFAAAFAVGLQARERANNANQLYGYKLLEGPASPSCSFEYINLASTASTVVLDRSRADAAIDDQAALVALVEPFELYQTPVGSLVVSGNGYLAAANSLHEEDGTDFSNDCGLPVRADNPAASQNRIYVYHDDLRPQRGAHVRQAHFTDCPRRSASGAPESCTVIEWSRFERAEPIPSTRPLRMQAVMYHASQAIALQYDSVDDSQASQATIGLQGFDGRTATEAGCNRRKRVVPGQALCFFDPRHPPAEPTARHAHR